MGGEAKTFADAWETFGYTSANAPMLTLSSPLAESLHRINALWAKTFPQPQSVPQPSGRAEANKPQTPEKKGNTMNLYASYTKTKGGYRAQITLDGDDVIWEGTEVHGEVRNDEGRLVDSGNAAAQREASELITSTFTSLLATPAKA